MFLGEKGSIVLADLPTVRMSALVLVSAFSGPLRPKAKTGTKAVVLTKGSRARGLLCDVHQGLVPSPGESLC